MWKIMSSMLEFLVKNPITFLWIGFLLLLVSNFYLTGRLKTSRAEYAVLEEKYYRQQEKYVIEKVQLQHTIDDLNASIASYRLDIEKLSTTLSENRSKLLEALESEKQALQEALREDPSTGNQLRLIDEMLHEFSN